MTRDEKGVLIQKQSITVSLKALGLLKCLNTFVHDCPSEGQLVYIACRVFFSGLNKLLFLPCLCSFQQGK